MNLFLLLLFLCISPWIHGSWVEDELATMTLKEKVGQLFIIRMNLDACEHEFEEVQRIIVENSVGGVIFLHQGTCAKQYYLMEKIKSLTKIPLLFCQDAEWGLAMRIIDVPRYPKAMTLGALENDGLIYALGKKIGHDCKALGIDINFAPVIDINSNIDNAIIGMRSFGDEPQRVAQKAIAYFKGMQDGGVLTCAKHFPGHGDTHVDSHIALPVIKHERTHLNAVELLPFKKVIAHNVDAIMIGHLHVPSLDNRKNRPASLSYEIVTGLLKEELDFEGLIITDALDMAGVTRSFTTNEIAIEALRAGSDMLLCSDDVCSSIQAIIKAIDEDIITEKEIDKRVLKILKLKERRKKISENLSYGEINDRIHNQEGYDLKRLIYEKVITSYGKHIMLPESRVRVAVVAIGESVDTFCQILKKYHSLDHFFLPFTAQKNEVHACIEQISQYNFIIFSLSFGSCGPIGPCSNDIISMINSQEKSCLILFCSPYALRLFDLNRRILIAYENDEEAQRAVALSLLGKLSPQGVLPIKWITN